MSCLTQLVCSQYADAALPDDEHSRAEAHLLGCADCRQRVADCRAEMMSLRSALQQVTPLMSIPPLATPSAPRSLLVWFGWAALLACVVHLAWLRAAGAGAALLPAELEFLLPNALDIGAGALFGAIRLLRVESTLLLGMILQSIGQFFVMAVAALGITAVSRRRAATSLCALIAATTLLGTAAPNSYAFEVRHDDDQVVVAAGETVDDTLIVFSNSIVIDGDVTGDLVAFGEDVSVNGRIGGTLISAAEELTIRGDVGGNVFGAGETVEYRMSLLGGNLYSAGETVTVHNEVQISGNAALAGQDVEVHGTIGRDLLGAAEHLSIAGTVDGQVRAVGERIDLAPSARVGGDVSVRVKSDDKLRIADGATINGTTNTDTWPEEPSKYATLDYYVGQLVRLLAALLTGWLVFLVFPSLRDPGIDDGMEALATAGLGVAALVAVPVLALATALTLVGLPLGIAAGMLWIVALYVAGILTAALIGEQLLGEDNLLALLAGLAVLFVLMNLPLIGGPVRLLATVVGLGLIVRWLRDCWRARGDRQRIEPE